MSRPSDPVIQFILNDSVPALIMQGSEGWPYSRLSYSRLEKIGYKLIVLRCAQLGIEVPSRDEVRGWRRPAPVGGGLES